MARRVGEAATSPVHRHGSEDPLKIPGPQEPGLASASATARPQSYPSLPASYRGPGCHKLSMQPQPVPMADSPQLQPGSHTAGLGREGCRWTLPQPQNPAPKPQTLHPNPRPLPCRARPPGVRHEDFQAELRRRYAGTSGMASRNSISSLHSDLASVADFLQQRPSSL